MVYELTCREVRALVAARGGRNIERGDGYGWVTNGRRVVIVADAAESAEVRETVETARNEQVLPPLAFFTPTSTREGGGNKTLASSSLSIPVVRVSWLLDGISAHIAFPDVDEYLVGILRGFETTQEEPSEYL